VRRAPARRRRFGRRGLLATGLAAAVVVAGAGGFLAYLNTLPTTVAVNIRNGQKDVPTDGAFQMDFSRAVSLADVQAAFSVSPSTAGTVRELSGQTNYAWVPARPLTELTTYTVKLLPIYDVGHHRVGGGSWTFTTIIVPRVTAVTAGDGTALTDGMELDMASSLRLQFNDAMDASSVHATIGGKAVDLTWAADGRSATLSTAGLPSGPIDLAIAPGGRDQTGHIVPAAFSLQTGIYWHDHEKTITLRYPALIQIPNDEFAWDQNGLQAAGVVFEYLAEGGITRLTAIYQNVPSLIGPMRSSRFISLKIARHYRGLLFQSGESQATRARAAQDPVPQFFDTIGYQYRTAARYAPDNLMINGSKVQAAEKQFNIASYVVPKARPTLASGTPAGTVTVSEHYSVYRYDAATGTYTKTELGHAYKDASLKQPLRIEMLIVLHTREQLLDVGDGHGAHIHDFDLDSSGAINVYYKGLGYKGTWKSTSSNGPLSFTVNGQPLPLAPGLVWIDVTQ
jgi:Protein of unknown function (DUF3048) N-terminal domain/Protein of unknown function (DUF3048) C-terminal domain/Bacterial Ig-like domain